MRTQFACALNWFNALLWFRLHTAYAAPKSPSLKVRKDGVTLAAFHDSKPSHADFLLQPRAVAVLRMFS